MKAHRWSGWPGDYCLDCGWHHALEDAIGAGEYDPLEDKWYCTDDRKQAIEKHDGECLAEQH